MNETVYHFYNDVQTKVGSPKKNIGAIDIALRLEL